MRCLVAKLLLRSQSSPRAITLGLAVLAGAVGLVAPLGPAQAGPGKQEVLLIGDSLGVGARPFVESMLTTRHLTWDVRSGRTTPQGIQALRKALRTVRPQTVVISLGTNDGSDPRRFRSRLRRTLQTVPRDACVIWATVVRPPRKGAYHALNRVLRSESRRDRRLVLINWDRAVARGEVKLPDGVHADRDGYRQRGQMIASAVRRGCDAG